MDHAVIKTGGKQYVVKVGDKLRVDNLPDEEGKKVNFAEVLLWANEKETAVGVPLVKGATVEGKVIRHGRSAKITGVKMAAKKRRKKYFGHRQGFTEVEITKISQGK